MATPTPGSASKRPNASASTPSHLNHSSPPRSVPSPVTARQAAGKTPVNHPTTGSSQGSKTLGSTPMVQNLSQSGHAISPSANTLSFGTPTGLGIEGATPAGLNGLNLPTPALAATQMMPTMSELGLTTSSAKRNEDEERRTKMRRVMKAISQPKGRVSEEGIARISRRFGFANDIDAEKLTPEEKERKVGNRPISTAGNTIVVEVALRNQVPRSVQVAYSVQSKALDEQAEKAGRVLLEDLRGEKGGHPYATLDRFAANLERLARLDRLSSGGVNCFEALTGVYASLRRLYDQELLAAKELSKDETEADEEVACRRSGRPVIHEHDKLGLAIEYWGKRDRTGQAKTGDRMDVDGQNDDQTGPSDHHSSFALSIEVEAASVGLYPPLRISETWLPDPFQLPDETSLEGIPWQDPPATFLPPAAGGAAASTDDHPKLPDLRFIAKLEPPLVMPYPVAVNIFAALGVSQPPMIPMPPAQYAALLLGQTESPTTSTQQTTPFTMSREREVLSHKDGQETTMVQSCTLESTKLDYGFTLSELPFSHPRQLVELLPTLRQWACISQILKGMFPAGPTPPAKKVATGQTDGTTLDDDSLDSLIDPPDAGGDAQKVVISISNTASPTPGLNIAFPTPRSSQLTNIGIDISSNAHLTISTSDETLANNPVKLQKLAKALQICGDLGVWIEWLRTSILA